MEKEVNEIKMIYDLMIEIELKENEKIKIDNKINRIERKYDRMIVKETKQLEKESRRLHYEITDLQSALVKSKQAACKHENKVVSLTGNIYDEIKRTYINKEIVICPDCDKTFLYISDS